MNPSFLIASSLPAKCSASDHVPIRIHTYSNPIDVRYATVRHLIPKLLFHNDATTHASESKYDVVLHIGLATRRDFYTLETCAHRDGYTKPDIDGQTLEDDPLWRDEYHAPEILCPTFDTADVWRRWKSKLIKEDIRPSDDAGHYLCDFIYYASMLEYWRRDINGKLPGMFLHVPGGVHEEDLVRGRRVAVGLIVALVESEVAKTKRIRVGEPRDESCVAE